MGISKIFKDKPKDEDAALPEVEGGSKKDKKKEKKDKKASAKKGKGEAVPAEVTRMSAEADDEDRVLAHLSPAAKLARQHTLRSRAEEAKRNSQIQNQSQGQEQGNNTQSGEKTWDNDTVTRSVVMPSMSSVLAPPISDHLPTSSQAQLPNSQHGRGDGSGDSNASSSSLNATTEVVHVQPRAGGKIHHAVNVSEAEYDSEEDNSSDDGETIDEVTYKMGRSKLSDEADMEFRSIWGNTWIDRNAVPKKGILKGKS